MILANRRVVLGVSGGIACYKSCTLARRLTELGATVDVILTAAATEFVRPLTFEALTQRPVHTSLWEPGTALAHLELGRGPDLIAVAPATANLIARAALGIADDLLSAILLASEVPVLAAPGMNDEMFAHPATQANLATLRQRGWGLIGPAVGPLAEGPSDRPGRMVEPEEILVHVERALRTPEGKLGSRHVLITAGPTHEPLDAVRVITNPSSGKMGYHLAERAFARGADVTLISGPTSLPRPTGVEREWVTTTEQLREAVGRRLGTADVLIMAAAPSDFRAREVASGKPQRATAGHSVHLDPTVDVLEATIPHRRPGTVTVGFALEVGANLDRAREKLRRKQLDLIALNPADEPESGFAVDTNRVTFVTDTEVRPLELLPKPEVAERILDEIEGRL